MDELRDYFIEHTNKRFDSLESKVDKLVSFRWILIGVSIGVSGILSFMFRMLEAFAGGK
jgi:hypothetical protein